MARLKDTQGMAPNKGIFVPMEVSWFPMQKLSVLSVFTEASLHSHK